MKLLILLTALSSLLTNLETKTLQSDISLTIQAEGQAALTSPGKCVMQGRKFRGTVRGYEVAYDGSTLYFYDPDANELTLSHPTAEELLSTNPLLFARSMAQVSTVKETVNKDGTITTITLVPKGTPAEQMKITLKIKGDMPLSVELKEPHATTSLRLKNPQYITSTPDFHFTKSGAFINDLR